jgi:hypothetical protein
VVSGGLAELAAGRSARLALSATMIAESPPRQPGRPPEPPAGVKGGWFAYAGSQDPGGDRLVITEVPYGVTLDEVVHGLAERVRASEVDLRRSAAAPTGPPSDGMRRAPVADIWDESSAEGGVRIVCLLRPDAAG